MNVMPSNLKRASLSACSFDSILICIGQLNMMLVSGVTVTTIFVVTVL